MKPIKVEQSAETKEQLRAADAVRAKEGLRNIFRQGYDEGWRRGFRIGAPLAFAATSLVWAVVLVVVLVAR